MVKQKFVLKKWQRVYVIAFFQYVCICLCVCVPVRVTYAPQNGMREK